METLRTRVQARCASLNPGAEGGDDFRHNFKWDRDCEEALYTVVINSQRMDKCVLNQLVCKHTLTLIDCLQGTQEHLQQPSGQQHLP
jgi:uncharacterized protein (DUF2132 family)